MEETSTTAVARWYGRFEIPPGSMGRWCIGPFCLWISRLRNEWRIAHQMEGAPLDEVLEVSCPLPIEELPADAFVERFPTHLPGQAVSLAPRLADRPVVVRPEVPIHVPAEDEFDLFVGTPLWVRIATETPERQLIEIPTTRLSDTWFGPDTRRGELCYASRTLARLNLENVPIRPFRAITRITVRNRASDGVKLERLSIPAPNLELFVDPGGRFWTQSVIVDRGAGGTEVDLSTDPPPEAAPSQRVAEARTRSDTSVLKKALQVLLG